MALGLCAVWLASPPSSAQTSIFGLKNTLIAFALEQISTPDEFEITFDEIGTAEEGATDLIGVRIADGQGVWLEAERISMRWNDAAILTGVFDVPLLAAEGVRVLRRPTPSGVAIEVREESALAADDGDPFNFPRSPITLRVGALTLTDVTLAADVLGPAPIRFDADGAARDEGDEQSVRLAITRRDAIDGRIALDYRRDFAADTLRLSLDASEDAGGLVAALAGLPEESASRVRIEADGPLSDWRASVEAASDDVFTAAGSATMITGDRLSVAADFAVTPGALLDPTIAQALSPQARLVIDAAEGETGLIDIAAASITAADLSLEADGTIARADGALDLRVSATAESGLGDLVEGVDFERIGFTGTAEGALDRLLAEGDFVLTGLAAEAVDLETARLNGVVRRDNGAISAELDGLALGLRLDRLSPDAIGPASLQVAARYAENVAAIDRLDLSSALLTAEASGAVDLERDTVGLSYALRAPDLATIARSYGATIRGAATAEGRLEGPLSQPEATGTAVIDGLRIDQTEIGRATLRHKALLSEAPSGDVSAGLENSPFAPATAAARFAMAGDALQIDGIEAAALGATLKGSATARLESGLVDGDLRLAAPDLSSIGAAFDQQVAGAAAATLTLTARDGRQSAALDLATERVASGDLRVARATLAARARDLLSDQPSLASRAEMQGAAAGDATIAHAEVTTDGPISALRTTLSVAGALSDKPLSARLDGVLDGEATSLRLSSGEMALANAAVSLRDPLEIKPENQAWRLSPIALALPGGVLDGEATLHPTGYEGAVDLRLDALETTTDAFELPDIAGALSADLTFDTRPASAAASLSAQGRALRFARAQDPESAFQLDLNGAWDGARARADARISGPFGEPATAMLDAPLIPVAGAAPTAPEDGEISGALRWSGDIGDLWALVPAPDHVLDGSLRVDATLGGAIAAPDIAGDISLWDGRYENLTLGTILTELTAETSLSQTEGGNAVMVEFSAKDGAEATLAGTVALSGGALEAQITAREAVLVRRDDVTAEVSLDLVGRGEIMRPEIAGLIQIDRAEARLVNATPPNVSDLGPVKILGAPEAEPESAAAARIGLDLRILAEDDVFVRGRGLDSEWRMDLAVAGDAASPQIRGSIDKVRGQLSFLGRDFDLERGRVAFIGAVPPDPTLDIALMRENDGLTGGIMVTGPAGQPDISFTSQPSVPEEDVLPRILFGRSQQSLTAVEALQLANGLRVLFDGGAGVLDSIRSIASLDVLRVEDRDGATNVTLGDDVVDGVFVGVSQPIDGGPASVRVEIEVLDNVTVDSEVGQDSGSAIGLNWRWDF